MVKRIAIAFFLIYLVIAAITYSCYVAGFKSGYKQAKIASQIKGGENGSN